MPLYEYRCPACGHIFERLEAVSAGQTRSCPVCPERARRQLAVPSLRFVGSGWFVNDYGHGRTRCASTESGADDAQAGAA